MDKPYGSRVPAPIFQTRRKPRPALFAHPNNDTITTNSNNDVRPIGTNNDTGQYNRPSISGFSGGPALQYPGTQSASGTRQPWPGISSNTRQPWNGNASNTRQPWKGNNTNDVGPYKSPAPQMPKPGPGDHMFRRQPPTSMPPGTQRYGSGYSRTGAGGPSTHTGSVNFVSGRKRPSSSTITSLQDTTPTAPSASCNTGSLSRPNRFQSPPPNPASRYPVAHQPNQFGPYPVPKNVPGTSQMVSTKPIDQFMSPTHGDQPWGNPVTPGNRYYENTSSGIGSGQTNQWNPSPSKQPDSNITNPTSMGKKSNNSKDKSVHFITATIEGMRHWSHFSQKVALLFEIYGMLNSAVPADGSVCINFILKDDKDSMKCTFFQIDRQLPRLVRGRWYRCVGNLDEQAKVFKCVSVGIAKDSDLKYYKTQVNVCDKSMRVLVSTLNET